MNNLVARIRSYRPTKRHVVVLAVVGIAVVVSVILMRRPSKADENTKDRFFEVARGNFSISVDLDGNLDAIEHHKLVYDGRGMYGLEIAEVVEDKTEVTVGQSVVRFDDKQYVQAHEKLLLAVEDAEKNMLMTRQDGEMKRVNGINGIKFAADQLRSAKQKLVKYEHEDARKKNRSLSTAIDAADRKQEQAERHYKAAQAKVSAAHMQDKEDVAKLQKQLDQAEEALKAARAAREEALYAMRVFKRYDHPEQLLSLQEAVTKSSMQLQQETVQASANVVKSRRQIQNVEALLAQQGEELVRLTNDIAKLVVKAPVDGILSHGRNQYGRSSHRSSEPKEIKIGTKISPGETIATIPDLSKFMVLVNLPEEFRSRVREGLKASLRSKALPDLVLDGEVKTIARMATHVIYWDKNSPKIYPTQIATEGSDDRLMPGMTMRVEIHIEDVVDVLCVPIEAVYNREGAKYCKVRALTGMTEVEVETDRSSTDYVEITSGLRAGQEVLLHRE